MRTCSHHSARVENEHTASGFRVGQLDGGEAARCVVGVFAACCDAVEVERQGATGALDGDSFREGNAVDEPGYEVQDLFVRL